MLRSKRFISLLITLVTVMSVVFSMPLNASAVTSGSSKKSWSGMQVWTNKSGSTPTITLSQNPAKYNYYKNGKQKQSDVYIQYFVTFKPISTVDGKRTNARKVTGWLSGSSKKFNLKKGIYYEVDIETYDVAKLPKHDWLRKTWYSSNSSWYLSRVKNCSNYK